jgi:superfamily I DNA/RNA helicase
LILPRLIAPADANICVIGDPDQAIYAFRGADASCFGRFKRD